MLSLRDRLKPRKVGPPVMPMTRDDLNIEFDERYFTNTLQACERNLSKMSIPFNELYESSKGKKAKEKFIFSRKLYYEILNHISEIGVFAVHELTEQKDRLNLKLMNKLILSEANCKADLLRKLNENKDVLFALHKIIIEMNKMLKAYNIVSSKNNALMQSNFTIEEDLRKAKNYEAKLKNNIKYYLVKTREKVQVMDRMKTEPTSPMEKKKRGRILRSCFDTKNYTTAVTQTMSSINDTSDKMRKTYRYFCNKTIFLTKEKERKFLSTSSSNFFNNDNKFSSKSSSIELLSKKTNEVFKKVIGYIEESKVKYNSNNSLYNRIFHKTPHLTNYQLFNEYGFRKIFIDKLCSDESVLQLVSDRKIPTLAEVNYSLIEK